MPAESRHFMKRRLENRYHISWTDISLKSFASKMTARLVVYHDPKDMKVPFREGQAIAAAWPGALLVPVRGVGHHRILRDPEVIRGTAEFLAAGAPELPFPELPVEPARAS